MSGKFSRLHARAFSHATEDLDKVKAAVINAVGVADLAVSRLEGHHGNPIEVVEATLEREADIVCLFERLSKEDLRIVRETLPARIDDSCNLFVKLDKQAAFRGTITLGSGDDVISVRIKMTAFPARPEIAQANAREHLDQLMGGE